MCKWGTNTLVNIKIPADMSHTGEERWEKIQVDSCIAPIVKALQDAGIGTRGCCCGHNSGIGDIHLQDGRVLLIVDESFLQDKKAYLEKMSQYYE